MSEVRDKHLSLPSVSEQLSQDRDERPSMDEISSALAKQVKAERLRTALLTPGRRIPMSEFLEEDTSHEQPGASK